MDHPEAHERIADLILEPHSFLAFEADRSPEADALRAHIHECDVCRGEFEGWQRTHAAVISASGPGGSGDSSPGPRWTDEVHLRASASLRSTVFSMARTSPRTDSTRPPTASVDPGPIERGRRSPHRVGILAGAAVLLVVVGVGAVAVDQVRQSDVARTEAAELADLAAMTSRILTDPDHVALALTGIDRAAAGVALWSADQYVITTNALTAPPAGFEYRCWLLRDGVRTPIGTMHFAADTAFWSGRVDVARGFWRSGGQLGVSLEPIGGDGSAAPILVGRLSG